MGERRDPHRFDDLFTEFGPIALRRFFGGEGVCCGEMMFGMIFSERIYFKTDEHTRKAFLAESCGPFSFKKGGETIVTGWHTIPDRLYDDPQELARWAKEAFAVATASETVAKKQRKRARETAARSSLRTRSRALRATRHRRGS